MPNTKAQEEILAWMRNNTDKLIDLAKASESPAEFQVRVIFAMERERRAHKMRSIKVIRSIYRNP